MKTLSIDIETFSPEPLAKCGVYRYCQAPEFEVLLFGYSVDSGPVRVVDLTAGERIPADVLAALTDPAVSKWAFNAQFERVCLSRYLGYPVGSAPLPGGRRRRAGAGEAEAQGRQRPGALFLHAGEDQGWFRLPPPTCRRAGEVGRVQGLQPPGCGDRDVHPAEAVTVPGLPGRVGELPSRPAHQRPGYPAGPHPGGPGHPL